MNIREITKCNICGGELNNIFTLDFKDIIGMAENYSQKIGICPQCGFIVTMNPFTQKLLDNRYKNYSKFEFDDEEYILDEKDDYRIRSTRQFMFIDRIIDLQSVNSILEVGASSGYNLSLYKDKLKKCIGIEPSEKNCINAKKIYDIDMFSGTFDEFCEKEQHDKFDIVFLSMVLEHIVNPVDFIGKCAALNNAYIFIEVPTLDYKFMDEPYGMFCEEHVNLFTLQNLEVIMNKCGYELLNADIIVGVEQTLPAGFPSLCTMWRKKCNMIRTHQYVTRSEELFDCYIRSSSIQFEKIYEKIRSISNEKKIAIWGTGHHASMLLANTELLKKNIVRVYDSDKRKKGMKMAGISICPFDSADIEKGDVEAILIASYTAQKPIKKVALEYSKQCEIITLYDD